MSTANDTPDINQQLTDLLRHCSRFMYYHSRPGMQQAMVLRMLLDGPMTQKQIQDKLGTKPGSVSELISKLEAKHLLMRQRSETDRRRVLLTLTCKGKDTARNHREYATAELYEVLTQPEREALAQLLAKLLSSWTQKRG